MDKQKDYFDDKYKNPDVTEIITHLELIYNLSLMYDFESALKVYQKIESDINNMDKIYFNYKFSSEICSENWLSHFLEINEDVTDKCHYGCFASISKIQIYNQLKVWKDNDGFAYVYNEFNEANGFKIVYITVNNSDNYNRILFDDLIKSKLYFTYHYKEDEFPPELRVAVCLKFSEEFLIVDEKEEKTMVALLISKKRLYDLSLEWGKFINKLRRNILDIGLSLSIDLSKLKLKKLQEYQDINGFFNLENPLSASEIFYAFKQSLKLGYTEVALSILERHFNERNNTI